MVLCVQLQTPICLSLILGYRPLYLSNLVDRVYVGPSNLLLRPTFHLFIVVATLYLLSSLNYAIILFLVYGRSSFQIASSHRWTFITFWSPPFAESLGFPSSRLSYHSLLDCSSRQDRARLLASLSKESGAWLDAMPIGSIGLRLEYNEVHIAIGLRLGLPSCIPHNCSGVVWVSIVLGYMGCRVVLERVTFLVTTWLMMS